MNFRYNSRQVSYFLTSFFITFFILKSVWAIGGDDGLSAAETQVKSYFKTATNLVYAIGAIVGLVGAIKVFSKWNNGDPDTAKVASGWFGSCIFLVIVATVLKGFFGV